MHLVYRALERNPVPVTLPPEMIPPSKRKRGAGLIGAIAVMPAAAVPPSAGPVVPGVAVPLVPGAAAVPVSTAGRVSPTAVSNNCYYYFFFPGMHHNECKVHCIECKQHYLQSGQF